MNPQPPTPPNNKTWSDYDKTYIMNTFSRFPLAIVKGEGNHLLDVEGKRYLDLASGIGVNLTGYGHPYLQQVLQSQSVNYLHISNMFSNPPAIRLAKKLVTATFSTQGGKVFFTNSGTEATEAALKIIHRFHHDKSPTQPVQQHLLVLEGSFHGRTAGSYSLSPHPAHAPYPRLPFHVHALPREDLGRAREVFSKVQPSAIFLEPILGNAGVLSLSKAYLHGLVRLAQEYKTTLVVDEIQTGMGRTGYLFAYQYAGIMPDLILFAKGIGGGLPLGGVVARGEYGEALQPGDHGSTFAPSPLAAAMGDALLDLLLTQGLLQQARGRSLTFAKQLRSMLRPYYRKLGLILRGRAWMLAMDGPGLQGKARWLQQTLLQDGFVTNVTAGHVLRLLPPLTLTSSEWEGFLTALEPRLVEMAG
ncbi:aspartate aminotransferase family protein [Pasteuria penetrans]|uniref:aspartate aminotransferase family protein n=1 Tax=Pasteuria penetrans TaxID=86005 RepID=UPI000FA4E67B|nr:aminotransferase class III-fold pyridoxal phosphate-dependent enzyme [Pasteuria penetrans]